MLASPVRKDTVPFHERLSYNMREAARVIGVSVPLLSEMIHSGQIATIRYGTRLIIPRKSLEAFLDQAKPEQ